MSDRRRDDFVAGTPAERIGLVWPLTREVASLSKRHDKDIADAEALEELTGTESSVPGDA